MAERFVTIDRNIPLLQPQALWDWVVVDDPAHFATDADQASDLPRSGSAPAARATPSIRRR